MGRQRRTLTPDQSPAHLWGARLRAFRDARRLSLPALGELARYDPGYLGRLERGDQFASRAAAEACDMALEAGGELTQLWGAADHARRQHPAVPVAQAATAPEAPQVISESEQRLIATMPLHAVTYSYG
jgi:transcriptional regulator with XRE-family HTH domain